jgi:D-sedoheptulose 7-phosphate isomerase
MFSSMYMDEVSRIAKAIDTDAIESLVDDLYYLRKHNGRLFILGIGGSAGNASHMVNDLRKLCEIEAYAPTDNASELTARTNDEGFNTIFEEYLKVSKFNRNDAIFILSVGGGNKDKNVSIALCNAIDYVKQCSGLIYGIVGREDGYTKELGDIVIPVPLTDTKRITPHSESFQAVVWHCIVSHPRLQINSTKW